MKFVLLGGNVNLLGPILDKSKVKSKDMTKALSDVARQISEDDFGRKFSFSISFWLDSFPMVPKTIISIKRPNGKEETMLVVILVGSAFVEMRFVTDAAILYFLAFYILSKLDSFLNETL